MKTQPILEKSFLDPMVVTCWGCGDFITVNICGFEADFINREPVFGHRQSITFYSLHVCEDILTTKNR